MLGRNVLSRLSRYNSYFNEDNLREYLGLLCSDYGIVSFTAPEKKDKYYVVELISAFNGSHSTFYFNHDRFRFVNVLHNQQITEIEFDACLNIKQKTYIYNNESCSYGEVTKTYSYLHTTDSKKKLTSLDFVCYYFEQEYKNVFDFKEQYDSKLKCREEEKIQGKTDIRLKLLDDNEGRAVYFDEDTNTYINKSFTESNLDRALFDIMFYDIQKGQMHRRRNNI